MRELGGTVIKKRLTKQLGRSGYAKNAENTKTRPDGWAGAVLRKPIAIQKYFRPTDGRTDQHGKV